MIDACFYYHKSTENGWAEKGFSSFPMSPSKILQVILEYNFYTSIVDNTGIPVLWSPSSVDPKEIYWGTLWGYHIRSFKEDHVHN